MEKLSKFLENNLSLLLFWLILGLGAGFLFGGQMVGLDSSMSLLSPDRARSLHISQMLYGTIPLILSLLPFALFEKEGVLSDKGLRHLGRYFVVWNVFLLFMSMAILFGNTRGLPFYDFPYQLNFLLAFSGVFYLLALLDALRRYSKRPVWVNVSLLAVIAAPIALIVLMNPQYGQVEKTLIGPHGDNTLGMSFTLIPIYYLLIKLHATKLFIPRHHWLWIVPLVGYGASLITRNFFHSLSYNEEWFYQYLTFLYVPLLWVWLRDAGVTLKNSPFLVLSVLAFVFVDIQGNILFVPQLRELIHRNDLVVGHAHIAMGLGVAFMAFSIAQHLLPKVFNTMMAWGWTILMVFMAGVLSVAGLIEAGMVSGDVNGWLIGRVVFGFALVMLVIKVLVFNVIQSAKTLMPLQMYHWAGFLGDALGGLMLLLLGGWLFGMLGFTFSGTYEYVIFAFVIGTGMIHWYGLHDHEHIMASLSALIRFVVASAFAALFMAGILDELALLIAVYDASFAMIYFLWLRK